MLNIIIYHIISYSLFKTILLIAYRIAPNTAECVVTKLGPICHCKQELVLHGVKCEPGKEAM